MTIGKFRELLNYLFKPSIYYLYRTEPIAIGKLWTQHRKVRIHWVVDCTKPVY